MSTADAQYKLNTLKNRYMLLRMIEIILMVTGIVLLVFSILSLLIISVKIKLLITTLIGFLFLITKIINNNLYHFKSQNILHYINSRYPNFQDSADLLLLNTEELTGLQKLQKEKIIDTFELLYPSIKLPNHIGRAVGVLITCVVMYTALSGFARTVDNKISVKPFKTLQAIRPVNNKVFVESLSIQISPPVYVGLEPYTSKNSTLNLPEGSKATWLVKFSEPITDAQVTFSGTDSLPLYQTANLEYSFEQVVYSSGFYQLRWRAYDKAFRSDYYRIDMIKDQSPKIVIRNLSQVTALQYTDNLKIEVTSLLRDDYGLRDAQIIATVSKGSGESVKFREEQIRFSIPKNISGKQVLAEATLNLKKLGLEPGDELYFYVEAIDNKTPTANRERTETFFISLKDTTAYALISDDGLGVELMPEYFRSQRQIIIDTEKLIKQKKQTSKQQFNSTSNELGYDQKVLRLRYGQFLGEEADSGIPNGVEPEEHYEEDIGEGKEEDPTKAFGHQHDTKNEHNLVADNKVFTHKHKGASDKVEKEDPAKAFIHQHDNTDEATFFIQSIKSKLKAALSIMWDAELYLRLYQPDKSLPYQYKALYLLKEISNESRIYVHRMGFDPPPLKEEKRLTADLTEIKTSTNQYLLSNENKLTAIKKAFLILEKLNQEQESKLTPSIKASLTKAGDELAMMAVQEPGASLKSLSLIRNLVDDHVESTEVKKALLQLQKELWNNIPHQPTSVKKQMRTAHELDRNFIHALEELKHE